MDEVEPAPDGNASVDHWIDPDGAWVIKISGEVDVSNIDVLHAAIDPIIAVVPDQLIYDLSGLEFIDSSGLALLLAGAHQVKKVSLRDPSPAVRRIIEVTGLGDVLPIDEA